MKKRILAIYASVLSAGALYYVWGAVTGRYLPCLYHRFTGWLCPTCGVSRMFLALLRGDIAAAFAYNPVMFVLLFVWNAVAVLCFFGVLKNRKVLYALLGLSLAALVIFGILRNSL